MGSANSDLSFRLFDALFVGAGLDPPLHPSAATVFREGQDPPLRECCKNEQIDKLEFADLTDRGNDGIIFARLCAYAGMVE